MKVALCFWGLTRSLKYTNHSIQEKIINILKNASIMTTNDQNEQIVDTIELTIFLHTYKFKSKYNNPRAKEVGLELDFDDYKLLNADFVQIDDQDEIKKQLNLQQYRTHIDPWNSNYICVDNFICAMYSKQQLGKMVTESGQEFDRIIFLRPDVRYINKFDVSWLSIVDDEKICIPGFALFPDFNDRFCIANYKNAQIYCNLFDKMLKYSKRFPLHSERFQSHCLRQIYNLRIYFIPFYFNRTRANGYEEPDWKNYKRRNQMKNMSNNSAAMGLVLKDGLPNAYNNLAVNPSHNAQSRTYTNPLPKNKQAVPLPITHMQITNNVRNRSGHKVMAMGL